MPELKKTNRQENPSFATVIKKWLAPVSFILFIGLIIGLIGSNFQNNQSGAQKALVYYIQLRNLVEEQTENLLNYSEALVPSREDYENLQKRVEQTKDAVSKFIEIGKQVKNSSQINTEINQFIDDSKQLATVFEEALDEVIKFLKATVQLEQEYDLIKRLQEVKEGVQKKGLELDKIFNGADLLIDYNLVLAQKETNFLDKSDIQNQATEQLKRLAYLLELKNQQGEVLSAEQAQKLREIYDQSRLSFRQLPAPKLQPEWLITTKVGQAKQSLNTRAFQLTTKYGVDLEKLPKV